MKTILVYIQDEETAEQRVQAALSIARAASAHVTCLQVKPIETYTVLERLQGVLANDDVQPRLDEQAAHLRDCVEGKLSEEGVTWDYIERTGNEASEIVHHAALADIVVFGREARSEFRASATILLGDLLQSIRTPLVLPGDVPLNPTEPALIAWDGSYEAANAVRASVGLLKLASSVHVWHFAAKPEVTGSFPGTRLVEFLSRHGIHAELTIEALPEAMDDDFVVAGLMSRAGSLGAAHIVMGGYGHRRVREFLLGGVTSRMLSVSNVPVVISN